MAVAVNGSNLFVVDTYQPLSTCSSAAPCAGSVAVLPLSTTNTPGTAVSNGSLNYWPLTLAGKSSSDVIVPTGVNVLASGNSLFISAYDTSVSPTVGYVFGYSVASGGVLAPLPGSPYVVGTQPSGLASDKAGANLYVTDYAKTSVYGFAISANGLTKLSGSPYLAGNQPSAVAVDPTNGDVFVTNAEDSTVTSYTAASGVLTVAGTFTVGTQPVAIGIDPSKNHFLYTANFLAGTVSAFEIPTTGGTLIDTQNSPYASNALPTAVAAVPHSTN
jgi:DNA-binding beta-propeller fold protein YncE